MANEPESKTWEEAFDALRQSAGELRGSVGRLGASDVDESVARDQLRHDVSRLEQSTSELLAKLGRDVDARRAGLGASFDNERAGRSAEQIKSALDELAAVAGNLAADVASSASASLKEAEPELKSALRDLDNVIGSAATWIRSTVDPPRDQRGNVVNQAGQPPLDDF